MDLTPATKDELVDELFKREGVVPFTLPDKDRHYTLHITGKHGGLIGGYGNPGPVKILIIEGAF